MPEQTRREPGDRARIIANKNAVEPLITLTNALDRLGENDFTEPVELLDFARDLAQVARDLVAVGAAWRKANFDSEAQRKAIASLQPHATEERILASVDVPAAPIA